MSDEPIEPLDFLGGVKVVDIGDMRVARGLTRRPHSSCGHRQLVYDNRERRVWCKDCERDVDSFDAFTALVEHFHGGAAALKRREDKVREAEAFSVRSRAAKEIDQAWRRRNSVPACPSCSNGLFPEDFASGKFAELGRDYALARRGKPK